VIRDADHTIRNLEDIVDLMSQPRWRGKLFPDHLLK